jgi:hypothetical protein
MPSLESKQAKLILSWHRERHYPVVAQIRADLPRFRHLSGSRGAGGKPSSATRRKWLRGRMD